MIISRAPYRITLAGGGTDLPLFYTKYAGAVTSMAIDKYLFVSFKRNLLSKEIRLQYLKTEVVNNVNNLSHHRARAALKKFNILDCCEISSAGDLPSQTGLGSSSSYLVSLINCLQEYKRNNLTKYEIANLACGIEMGDLQEPVGKQDQFISSYGGVKTFSINKQGVVTVEDLNMTKDDVDVFIEKCPIYYTGIQRGASDVLRSQAKNKINFVNQMLKIRDLSYEFVEALETKNFDKYGILLDNHWEHKKKLSNKMTNSAIDEIYQYLKQEKLILGGKVIGAGGGGFLMVYVPEKLEKVDEHMQNCGMAKVDYSIDMDGVKTLYKENNK